jgi:hypothetical protein
MLPYYMLHQHMHMLPVYFHMPDRELVSTALNVSRATKSVVSCSSARLVSSEAVGTAKADHDARLITHMFAGTAAQCVVRLGGAESGPETSVPARSYLVRTDSFPNQLNHIFHDQR